MHVSSYLHRPMLQMGKIGSEAICQGHISGKGSSSSFDSSRNVPGSASYFLEPQVSVFLSMK